MGFFSDMFLGSRPDYRLPGYVTGQLGKLDDYFSSIGLDYGGKSAKHELKRAETDPASLATVSLSQGAVNDKELAERQTQGANALIGAGGGEQANLLNQQYETNLQKQHQNTALNAMQEATQRIQNDRQALLASNQLRTQAQLGTLGMENSLMGTGYDARRQGGIFNPQTYSNALAAFAKGAGMFA